MAQELEKLLEIPDQLPVDYYKNPIYLERTKKITELSASLVYEISDEGRAKAKADVAAIRKYVKTTDSFTLGVFRSLTDKVKAWRDEFTGETKKLSQTADDILKKFEVMEAEQLAFIRDVCIAELTTCRTKAGIREEFITAADLNPVIKLTGTLTPNQQMTAKARKFISDIAYFEKSDQDRYDSRCQTIKLKSLESDINPPLDPDYLGVAMFGTDDEFLIRLNGLIAIEIDRRKLAEERFKKQQEIENQRKIAEGIAKQKENERVENEQLKAIAMAEDVKLQKTESEKLRESAQDIRESAERAPNNEKRQTELAQAKKLDNEALKIEQTSRICTVTMTFRMPVKNTVSLAKLNELFMSEVMLSVKAKKSFISVESYD